MDFSSDNASGAAPEVMAAVAAANGGTARPYGADAASARVEARIRDLFEAPEAEVLLVATGTAANGLALAALCPPWAATFCHDVAHVEMDECNAPEFFTGGAKLAHVPGPHATMDADALDAAIRRQGAGVVHHAQPGAVSITQASERGAVLSPEEVARLAGVARRHGLPVHMDGTRFAAACAATGAAPAEMSWRAGVDALCLGATKTGALAAEAVILFEPARHAGKAWELALRRKRAGHLVSKMRFVAAQMDAWLAEGLWLRLAAHANAMAAHLRAALADAGVAVLTPPGANLMFVRLSAAQHAALETAGARYYAGPPDAEGAVEARLVCSFDTDPAEVDRFAAVVAGTRAPA